MCKLNVVFNILIINDICFFGTDGTEIVYNIATDKQNKNLEAMRTQESNTTNNQTTTSSDALTQYSNDNQIEKIGGNTNHVDESIQKHPDKIQEKHGELKSRLDKLANLNQSIINRWAMSKEDKELVRLNAEQDQKALAIIRERENNDLTAAAAYQTRYLKSILHNLVVVGEGNMTNAAKRHFDSAKMILHTKLLEKLEEVTLFLEDFEKRAANRPEKFRKVLLQAAERTLSQWWKDYDVHVEEFSNILNKLLEE